MNDGLPPPSASPQIAAAEVLLLCAELQPNLDFFVERLGFRLERISPADDPRSASLSGHGLRLRLRVTDRPQGDRDAGTLVLHCETPLESADPRPLRAPNGTQIEWLERAPELDLPPLRETLVVTRASPAQAWVRGRAGMRYRDLLPGRLGGRFIASHIQIPDGGPVPDAVHFHAVRLQLIYCRRGWVRVLYEDQGPSMLLQAGDCVLQPPGIRHRVLESSPGLEVLEVACPAAHETHLDHELALPTAQRRVDREFSGQRFVRHVASEARWGPWRLPGFECRDLGIAAATSGLAGAQVVRSSAEAQPAGPWRHAGELGLLYVLAGSLHLGGATDAPLRLGPDDCIVVPAGVPCSLSAGASALEFLELRLPAE